MPTANELFMFKHDFQRLWLLAGTVTDFRMCTQSVLNSYINAPPKFYFYFFKFPWHTMVIAGDYGIFASFFPGAMTLT